MINLGQIGQITKTFRTSSAAVPALILSTIFGPICVVGAILAPEPLNIYLGCGAVGSFALPALQILFFTAFDRDRLQNEEHVENKLLIAQGKPILGDRGGIVDIEPTGDTIENPALEGRVNV